MAESSKNIAVGILVSCGIGLVVWVLLFLHPQFGDGDFKLHTRFTDIEKITVGTRVSYAGRPIGEVQAITPIPREEAPTANKRSPIYCYDVELAIDSHVVLYSTDDITLSTSGLMGERFISIIPRQITENSRILTSDDIVHAKVITTMSDTFSEISTVALKAEKAIDDLAHFVKGNQEAVHETLRSITQASNSLDTLLKQTNDQNVVASIKRNSEQLEKTLASVEVTMHELQESNIVPKLATTASNLEEITTTLNRPEEFNKMFTSTQKALENFERTSEQIQTSWPKIEQTLDSMASASHTMQQLGLKANLVADDIGMLVTSISEGKGTVGKLLVSDDFYFKIVSCMNKVETLMNDVNHYGVLFHLDKGWQRDRRQRISELAKLEDPKEFQKYLDDEMAKINTALSRVGLAAEKAHSLDEKSTNGEFSRSFSDLLAQLESLQGNLKSYSSLVAEGEKTS